MSRGKLGTLFIVFVILLSLFSITSSNREPLAVDKPQKVEVLSEEVNIISNAGFESGGFSPWVNQGGTTYNEIQSSRVYSGTYALYMNSHLSSAPYEPVYQEIDTEIPLFETQTFSFAVYPTKVGNTAGEAGVDQIWIGVYNRASDTHKNVFYEWSGYTYPGGALGVNVTKVLYLLFDLIPNVWNFVERNLYDDYCAFYGAPENNNDLVVNRITLLSHNSNGDPGDFWIDDLRIGTTEEEPISSGFNYIENWGFETGSFSPWVNEEGTAYNQIADSGVYDGRYSLFLDSHISSSPYEPVTQKLAVNATLTENLTVSAAIYPEKTGATCGQAGVSQFSIWFHNKETGQYSHIAYEWSGYTFPGNDLNSNSTYLRLLLFDWTPSAWNVLNRSVYHDYVSFFGVPTDMSQIEFYRVHILCHSSNGDPGNFLIDNVFLGNGSAPIIEPEPTTTTTSPDTTTIPTSATWFTNITGPNGDWIIMVFVGGGGMGVIIIVIIIILTRKSGSSGDVSPPYSW